MERPERGLSLIEVGLLLCLLGMMLAVAVPTFTKRVRTSKVSEAVEQLEALHKATADYYAAEWDGKRRCLPPAAGPTPKEPSPTVQVVDFSDPRVTGYESWAALGFQPGMPVRFSYSYVPKTHGCDLAPEGSEPLVVLRAEGDLDGDEVRSLFERHASVSEQGLLVPVGVLYVQRRMD